MGTHEFAAYVRSVFTKAIVEMTAIAEGKATADASPEIRDDIRGTLNHVLGDGAHARLDVSALITVVLTGDKELERDAIRVTERIKSAAMAIAPKLAPEWEKMVKHDGAHLFELISQYAAYFHSVSVDDARFGETTPLEELKKTAGNTLEQKIAAVRVHEMRKTLTTVRNVVELLDHMTPRFKEHVLRQIERQRLKPEHLDLTKTRNWPLRPINEAAA